MTSTAPWGRLMQRGLAGLRASCPGHPSLNSPPPPWGCRGHVCVSYTGSKRATGLRTPHLQCLKGGGFWHDAMAWLNGGGFWHDAMAWLNGGFQGEAPPDRIGD